MSLQRCCSAVSVTNERLARNTQTSGSFALPTMLAIRRSLSIFSRFGCLYALSMHLWRWELVYGSYSIGCECISLNGLAIAERLVQSGRRPDEFCRCVYAASDNPALPCMASGSQVRHKSLLSVWLTPVAASSFLASQSFFYLGRMEATGCECTCQTPSSIMEWHSFSRL